MLIEITFLAQNTTSSDGQIKQLVYMIENAVSNLPDGQEQMVWLVNFKGWSMSKAIPVRTTQEIAHVLQNHYPERLGAAILLDPPRLFETFWLVSFFLLDRLCLLYIVFLYRVIRRA